MTHRFIIFILLITATLSSRAQDNSPETQIQSSSPFNQSKFVPDISFIADFSYVARDLDNDIYSALDIPGLSYPLGHHHGEDDAHDGLNANRGFNFNYGEMTLYSIVDPYFDLFAVLHVAPEHAGLEEAYITTRQLPYGFQIKAGKFLSSIGRLNEQHVHSWDFVDRPLVSRTIFGDEGLNEIGARITWVAPTDLYLMLGAEILTGENESSFGTTGFSDPNSAVNIDDNQQPGLFVGYARTAFDVDEAAFLLGFSCAHGTTKVGQNFSTSDGEGSALDALTNILCGDLTIKYLIDPIRYISFQSEYLYRSTSGSFYFRDSSNAILTSGLDRHQAGFYSQLIAKLGLRWRIGVRYDLLSVNNATVGTTKSIFPENLTRYSAMAEYNPTEFSRLRMQYNYDRSKYIHPMIHKPFSEIILQLNVAIGAHGAHSF